MHADALPDVRGAGGTLRLMDVLLLTDASPGRPGYSAHVPLLVELLTELGCHVHGYGADRYQARFAHGGGPAVWVGPGLGGMPPYGESLGVLLPRVSAYGSWGLQVAGALAGAGWRSTEDLEAFAVGGDKLLAQQALDAASLATIPTVVVSGRADVPAPFPYPVVVKARRGSSGREVLRARDDTEWAAALARLWARGDDGLLVQPYLAPPPGSRSRDIRVHVVAGEPMFGMARVAAEGEWRTNSAAGAQARALTAAQMRRAAGLSFAAAEAVGLVWAAVDLLETSEGLRVCEVNPAPGLSAIVHVVGRRQVRAACEVVLRRASGR